MYICDRICEKDLGHSIVNIEKSRFEILDIVYFENV